MRDSANNLILNIGTILLRKIDKRRRGYMKNAYLKRGRGQTVILFDSRNI